MNIDPGDEFPTNLNGSGMVVYYVIAYGAIPYESRWFQSGSDDPALGTIGKNCLRTKSKIWVLYLYM